MVPWTALTARQITNKGQSLGRRSGSSMRPFARSFHRNSYTPATKLQFHAEAFNLLNHTN